LNPRPHSRSYISAFTTILEQIFTVISGILMSLNDPKWGKGGGDNRGGDGNQGPPDLDELWRDFNRRLSGMFGKTPGGVAAPATVMAAAASSPSSIPGSSVVASA
jgi:hypothetical protein